jgi:hypothetical protein
LHVTLAAAQQFLIHFATPEQVRAFFQGEEKTVVTFIGYSRAEYEQPKEMIAIAKGVLSEFDPAATIVNSGATRSGIGAVYEVAKSMGFMTTGIVSSQARAHNAEFSQAVDQVFFVEDDRWGGRSGDKEQLSPTSEAMVENSDVVIGIGGGEVGRDEMIVAARRGKKIRFFPADMNHQKAVAKAKKASRPMPTNFGGAAAKVFDR